VSSCATDTATSAGTCDGKSTCQTPAPVPCGAYACGATACKTTCGADSDCAPGNLCDATTSKCVSGATCDGDHTATGASGTPQDCAPYKCEASGICRSTCNSVADCVAPTVCDALGKCVTPAESASAAGCAVGTAGGGHTPWWALLAVASLAMRRRRDG
jgi:MYXO-CTERM domain-containing protein